MDETVKKSNNAEREEKILKFWQENDTFQKSLKKDAPKGNYVFYDGPPFATGLPHYGHILGSTAKDAIGRYKTMQGFTVPRKWGWDCHGLPIENIVEKDLGISGKKGIEEYGLEKFSEHARSKVLTYVGDWKRTVDRMGRWVDFDNSYKTMDNTFIESVWWALGELNKKELLYEGVRVLAYCPRCETPIANSEIAMDNSYKDITDISVYVKFELVSEPKTYLLAWTTTPWTLPGNTAVAVNKDFTYVYVKNNKEDVNETLILEKGRFEILKDKFTNPEILKEVSGSYLIGLSYLPVFSYYKDTDMPNKENIWKVWHADFITSDSGTGIAHEAPAFGEDDMNLAKANNIPFIRHVEPNGTFVSMVTDFAGEKAKPKEDHQSGDVLIIKYLAKEGALFAKEKIIHSYPHCYRCETPLLYYALPSWFVNIQKVKAKALEEAKSMNWIPSHLKDGRFNNILENAPDWTISRNRFWASPLPIWKNKDGKILFVNSLEDLKNKTKKSGNKYFGMRHGYGQHMEKGVVSSLDHDSYHLTEEGRNEVVKSATDLKNKGITKIFTSPLIRTKETAKIAAGILGINPSEIVVDDRIREYEFGEFNGKPWQEYIDYRDQHIATYDEPLGGSSLLETKKRFADFIYEIENNFQNENILIVTHGVFFETIPAIIEGANNERSLEIVFEVFNNARIQPAEVREYDFTPIPHNAKYELDMHRPYIDRITLVDENVDEYKRIPEVIDCWFESGSMPFAQDHYPFERPNWQKENFPAGFVAEYIAQTRTWFYYSHIISTILFGQAPFQNIISTGTVLAEDGEKMSKSKNNFTDPWIMFNKVGVDPIRFYLMSSQVMRGEDLNFSDKAVQDVASKIVGRLDNVVAFYELYRDKNLEPRTSNLEPSSNALDIWILARLSETINEVTLNMDAYDLALASRPFESFIEDLSTWYLRRSRDRIKDGDKEAKSTMYFVLKNLVKVMAPFTPFIAEDVWQRLKTEGDAESVHLAKWPEGQVLVSSDKVLVEMQQVRDVVTLGLEARQKMGIKVRQPLNSLKVVGSRLQDEYIEILKDELNIKNIEIVEGEALNVELDTNITLELKQEGDYRELLRAVQDLRKTEGLNPSDVVTLVIYTDENGKNIVEMFKNDFMKTAGLKEIKMEEFDGLEVKVGELVFKIKILK